MSVKRDSRDTPKFGQNGKSPNLLRRWRSTLFGGGNDENECVNGPPTRQLDDETSMVDSTTGKPVFSYLPDLASADWGAKVLFASDQFYGRADNLLKQKLDNTNADRDAWCTRRRRKCGHDWVIIQLAEATYLRGFDIDTSGLEESVAPNVSIEGGRYSDLEEQLKMRLQATHPEAMDGDNIKDTFDAEPFSQEVVETVDKHLDSMGWVEIIGLTRIKAQEAGHNWFQVVLGEDKRKITHLRLNLFPDGAIRRFRAYGECGISPALLKVLVEDSAQKEINMATASYGASVVWASVARGPGLAKLIAPYPPKDSEDGWCAPRAPFRPPVYFQGSDQKPRFPGEEFVVLNLASPTTITRVEIDTTHFIGNVPARISLYALECLTLHDLPAPQQMQEFRIPCDDTIRWLPLTDEIDVYPNCLHCIEFGSSSQEEDLENENPKRRSTIGVKSPPSSSITHLRVNLIPDGGIARIRVFGRCPTNPFVPSGPGGLLNKRRSTSILYSSLNSAFT